MPKIDILVPFRNSELYIENTIRSIFRQTYSDWRIVFVDDNSNDGSVEIIQKLLPASAYEIIRNETQLGVARALNIGLQHCTAPFICRIDSDDVMHRERLEYQLEQFHGDTSLSVISSGFKYVDHNGNNLPTRNLPDIFGDSVVRSLIQGNPICHPSVMFKVSGDNIFSYAIDAQEDYLSWLENRNIFNWKVDNKKLIKWRLHPLNSSKQIKSASPAVKKAHRLLCEDMGIGISNELQSSILDADEIITSEIFFEYIQLVNQLKSKATTDNEVKTIGILASQYFLRKSLLEELNNSKAKMLLTSVKYDRISPLLSVLRKIGIKL